MVVSRAFLTIWAVLFLSPAASWALQQPSAEKSSGRRLELTSASADASSAFRDAIYHFQNPSPSRSLAALKRALAIDPNFGLAQVYAGTTAANPLLSPAERRAQMARGLALMGNASVGEFLLALYWRENEEGRAESAATMLRMAAEVVPDEASVAFLRANAQRAGKTHAEGVRIFKEFVARFPEHAAAYNSLAYSQFRAGDRSAAYLTVAEYAKRAPDSANPHNSWSTFLLLDGKLEEARLHTQQALDIDPMNYPSYAKFGAIDLLAGNIDDARANFLKAVESAASPVTALDFKYWIAVSYLHARDTKGALRELNAIAAEAERMTAAPAVRALPHLRIAVIEALLGDKQTVAGHLARAAEIDGATNVVYTGHAALANIALNDLAAARANVTAYDAAATELGKLFVRTLNAAIALAGKDTQTAQAELAQADPNDLLAKELGGEVHKLEGRRNEARAVREEILRSTVRVDNNPPVDFYKVVARIRAEKL